MVDDPSNDVIQTSLHSQLGVDISAFLGLGTNQVSRLTNTSATFSPSFEDSLAGQHLLQHPQSTGFALGLTLVKPVIHAQPDNASQPTAPSTYSGLPAGSLRFLDVDSDGAIPSNVSWVAAKVQVVNGSVPVGDWGFTFDGWEFDMVNNTLQRKGPLSAGIDILYTGIYLPRDQASLIRTCIVW